MWCKTLKPEQFCLPQWLCRLIDSFLFHSLFSWLLSLRVGVLLLSIKYPPERFSRSGDCSTRLWTPGGGQLGLVELHDFGPLIGDEPVEAQLRLGKLIPRTYLICTMNETLFMMRLTGVGCYSYLSVLLSWSVLHWLSRGQGSLSDSNWTGYP